MVCVWSGGGGEGGGERGEVSNLYSTNVVKRRQRMTTVLKLRWCGDHRWSSCRAALHKLHG